jgi:hypothetical protein
MWAGGEGRALDGCTICPRHRLQSTREGDHDLRCTDLIYSVTDGKLVTAWGGIRNDAAHAPGSFARTAQDVGSMILGVREFIARHP